MVAIEQSTTGGDRSLEASLPDVTPQQFIDYLFTQVRDGSLDEAVVSAAALLELTERPRAHNVPFAKNVLTASSAPKSHGGPSCERSVAVARLACDIVGGPYVSPQTPAEVGAAVLKIGIRFAAERLGEASAKSLAGGILTELRNANNSGANRLQQQNDAERRVSADRVLITEQIARAADVVLGEKKTAFSLKKPVLEHVPYGAVDYKGSRYYRFDD